MKKFLNLILILFLVLIVSGCQEEKQPTIIEPETTPIVEEQIHETNISGVLTGKLGDNYKTKGIVTAINKLGVVISEGESSVYVHIGDKFPTKVKINDEIQVLGKSLVVNKTIRLTASNYEVLSNNNKNTINSKDLTLDMLNAYKDKTNLIVEHVSIIGSIKVLDSESIQLYVKDSNVLISLSSPTQISQLKMLDGKKVKLYGYTIGLNIAYRSYLEMMVTSYEQLEEEVTGTAVNFLSINDTHGAFLDSNDGNSMGRLDSFVTELREEDENLITIANGDIFQGSYLSNTYRGKPMIEALNMMEFDCFVIGNHEFDWGIEKIGLYKDGDINNGEADFPFLGANIINNETSQIVDWMEPYTIIDYNGINVGIIGVIGPQQESSILSTHVSKYNFINPLPLIEDYAEELRTEKDCDVVVVSIHDYDEATNAQIASLSGDSRIDGIFCGHTHYRYNLKIRRSDEIYIPVVQNNGKNITASTVTLLLDEDNQMTNSVASNVFLSSYKISERFKELQNKYQATIDEGNKVIAVTSYLSYEDLGAYAVDAMLDYNYNNSDFSNIDISIINTGGIRSYIEGGNVTISDVFNVFPFDNQIYLVKISGDKLQSLIDRNGSYFYIGYSDGLSSTFESNKIYTLSIIDYVFTSSRYNQFSNLSKDSYINSDIILRDILIDYIDALN